MSGNHYFCYGLAFLYLWQGWLSSNNLLTGRKKELLMYENSFMFSLQLMDGCWGTRDQFFYVIKRFFFSFEMNNVIGFVQGTGISFGVFWFLVAWMLCRIYHHRAFCVIVVQLPLDLSISFAKVGAVSW